MYIQHNLMSLNSFRNREINRKKIGRNLEKLTSGFRVNKAGDDAAGLAISEGMRSLIAGLNQASRNTEDGIGMIQTAEGAMQEIHAMLGRLHELSIQSSNGTYDQTSRNAIQEEADNILAEIDRISETTEFNGILVLQGKASGTSVNYKGTLPAWVNTGASMQDGHLVEEYVTDEIFVDDSGTETSYKIKHAAGALDFSAFDGTDQMKNELKDGGFHTTCFTCQRHYSIRFTAGSNNTVENSGEHYIYNIGLDNIKNARELVAAIISGTGGGSPNKHFTKLTVDPANPGALIVYDDRASGGNPIGPGVNGKWKGWDNPDFDIKKDNFPNDGKIGQGYAESADINGDIVLQVGPKEKDILKVDLPNISSAELNISNLTLRTQKGSSEAIGRLKSAIGRLSDERGRMGAYENRLDHTFLVLNNYNENLTKAESQIRDTDIAQEITEYTKNSIILQSAQNMLIKAKLMPETILQLLQ